MKNPNEDNYKVQLSVFFVVGGLEVAIGITLLLTHFFLPQLNTPVLEIMSNLGIGLIAAGIITITLEPFNRKQLRKDINDLKNSSAEAILLESIPEPIYKEIRKHIIQQPFLRENARSTFKFNWIDSEQEIMCRYINSSYQIRNVSKTIEAYNVCILEEREIGINAPDMPKIHKVEIRPNGKPPIILDKQSEIEKYITRSNENILFCYTVRLEPGEYLKVRFESESYLTNRSHKVVMLIPTINMHITVEHSKDTIMQASPLHPSRDIFVNEVNTDTLKVWSIEGGILPYQGVELVWGSNTNK